MRCALASVRVRPSAPEPPLPAWLLMCISRPRCPPAREWAAALRALDVGAATGCLRLDVDSVRQEQLRTIAVSHRGHHKSHLVARTSAEHAAVHGS